MKILFDQGTPVPLRRYIGNHQVDTAFEKGWSQLSNGNLLDTAEKHEYDLLITTDQNLKYQQHLDTRTIAIVVLSTTSWPRIREKIADIRECLDALNPGDYIEITV